MNIAIYHPGLNNFGGGELVCVVLAAHLSKKHSVTLYSPHKVDLSELGSFFGVDLSRVSLQQFGNGITLLPTLHSLKSSMYLQSMYSTFEKYDLVIDTFTNGWFSKQLACPSLCYVHYPFFQPPKKGVRSVLNWFLVQPTSAFCYTTVVCNSAFTQECLSELGCLSTVVHPPVRITEKKYVPQNMIISVGRYTYEKKHEVMIDAFKHFSKKHPEYSLHLVGTFREDSSLYDPQYYAMLKERAKGYPIIFHENIKNEDVLTLLGLAKIYWHARGYGETQKNEYENFGITTVEAMGARCVPIVINLGAQPEIVDHGKNGYCWNTPQELVGYTEKIIRSQELFQKLSTAAHTKSKTYRDEVFLKKIDTLIDTTMRSNDE